QQGISLLVFDGTTLLAKVPLQTDADGTLITTTNGTMQTKVSAAGMFLGGALVSSAVPSTVIPVEVDSTLKALSDSKELSNQINVAIEGFEPYDASKGDVTFTLSRNSSFPAGYTYTIYGFGAGDKIIGPSELDTRFSNDSFVDGSVTLTYGTFANVTLTGLTAAQDSALFSTSSFNDVFGPATLG
ncbi:MAG: hypothetical protein EB072_14005, partial [Betaproteobacteria bacterium]|nr:hypothetical protein [Betaproteobacteria bacterium]